MLKNYLASSIGKKQLIAVSGLAMVGFLIAHLAGNFLIFAGPEAYNAYSQGLKDLGALLWVARLGLIGAFLIHFPLTIMLVRQNRKARAVNYSQALHKDTRTLSTKLMPFSGLVLLVYVVTHLIDFTFTHASEANAMVNGEYLGLYGLVVNEFANPIESLWYIVAMVAVGFHLMHAVQSVFQTFGFNHKVYTPVIKKVSCVVGIGIAVGFASIPLYVLFRCASGSCGV